MTTDDDPAQRIGRGLRDVLAEAGPVQHALAAQLGIGTTDVQALQHLAGAARPAGTVDLGNLLRIRSASATALVDRLEAAGHLRRTPHPTDGRRVTLHLTAATRRQVQEALRPLMTAIGALVDRLTPAEADTVAEFLEAAVHVLHEYGGDPTAPPPHRRNTGR